MEVSPDEDELDESDDEEGDQEYIEVSSATNYTVFVGFPPLMYIYLLQNSIVPTFTVSVTKPSVSCIEVITFQTLNCSSLQL